MKWLSGLFTILMVLVVAHLVIQGAQALDKPKVRITYRSAVGPGYVLVIVNSGSKPLFNVCVTCDRWGGKSYIASRQLNVGSSVDAGWMELPEKIDAGVLYEISADGYWGSESAVIRP